MKKKSLNTTTNNLGDDIYSLGFAIDILSYILDTLELTEGIYDNRYFTKLDDIYDSLLTEIATITESLPSELTSDTNMALKLLPDSLFKLWEIEHNWQYIKLLLFSTKSKTKRYADKKQLKINPQRWEEKSKQLDIAEETTNQYLEAIGVTLNAPIEPEPATASHPIYTLKYDHMSGSIYINNLLIQRTRVDSSSDIIMSKATENPNKLTEFKENKTVNVSSFINNSLIPEELCALFFQKRSKKSLCLVPVITKKMAEDAKLDIDALNRKLEKIASTK